MNATKTLLGRAAHLARRCRHPHTSYQTRRHIEPGGSMKIWIKPSFIDRRYGFEINLYINHR
jgi:coenzyme PQQ precursor peptide PqqA